MEAGAISPDVWKACSDDNYTSLVHLPNEIPSSSGRGKSTQRRRTHRIMAAIRRRRDSGKGISSPKNGVWGYKGMKPSVKVTQNRTVN